MDNRTPLQRTHHEATSELMGIKRAERHLDHLLTPEARQALNCLLIDQTAKVDALFAEREREAGRSLIPTAASERFERLSSRPKPPHG